MDEDIPSKISKRLARDIEEYERKQRFKIHDKDEREVIEEVFDKRTLMVLYDILNDNIIKEFHGVIDAGKESRVYLAIDSNGEKVAVKIYLTTTAEFRKRLQYIIGDPRFKNVKKGIRSIVRVWARKEFDNLNRAYNNNVPVPKPIYLKENILIMQFIGNEERAPILYEVDDIKEDYYHQTIDAIDRLYNARLVHADLSEFNIFVHDDRIILFDFGSAVDLAHPNARYFLVRDISNINRFFSKHGINAIDVDDILRRLEHEL